MAWYNETDPTTLNFVLVGNYFAGHEILQSSLSKHPSIVCHGDVLNNDDDVRKQVHESYFGDSRHVPDWYRPDVLSVEQYLNNKIFDNQLHGEQAIGVQLNYQDIAVNDIWDYLQSKCREGDFCLLHVVRNPVACFVDYLRANGSINRMFDPDEAGLVKFVREHKAAEAKLNLAFDDRLVIPYHELLLDFKDSLKRILQYLERPFSPACIPQSQYGDRQLIQNRIASWSQLQADLPRDVFELVTSPTLL